MNTERPQDEIVSARYRELARERAPADLDDKVLRMAAEQAQHPRYSRSVMWTRPLAWAATIALCLAIALEVTRGPTPEDIVSVPARSDATFRDAIPAEPEAEMFEAEKNMLEADSPASVSEPVSAPQKLEEARSRTKVSDDDKEILGRSLNEQVGDEAVASPALELKVNDANIVQRAEDLALLQSGTRNEPAVDGIVVRSTAISASPATCPDEARAQPESWLECIEALEMAGDTEAAARERESLIEVFPDFRLP